MTMPCSCCDPFLTDAEIADCPHCGNTRQVPYEEPGEPDPTLADEVMAIAEEFLDGMRDDDAKAIVRGALEGVK